MIRFISRPRHAPYLMQSGKRHPFLAAWRALAGRQSFAEDNVSIAARIELNKSIIVLTTLATNAQLIHSMERVALKVSEAFMAGNKVFLAGDDDSAAGAQHMAREFVHRLSPGRPGISAFALTADWSMTPATENDHRYETLFARQVRSAARRGDIFWAYCASGHSSNILRALEAAKEQGIFTVGFTGNGSGAAEMHARSDICIQVPSDSPPRIQEAHLICGHIVCSMVEDSLFA